MIRILQLAIVAIAIACAGTTVAQPVEISLPSLIGPQSIESLDSRLVFALGRSASILKSSLPNDFDSVEFRWSGTIKSGRVVGDGVEREPIEQTLRGNFSTGLGAPGHSYGFFPAFDVPAFGPFSASWQLQAPIGAFIDRNCFDCIYEPEKWAVGLQLAPDYFALGNSIPFLDPPGEFESRDSNQGLILLEPIEVNITSAALVFHVIPEPNAAMLLLVGLECAIATWRRHPRRK